MTQDKIIEEEEKLDIVDTYVNGVHTKRMVNGKQVMIPAMGIQEFVMLMKRPKKKLKITNPYDPR